MPFHLHTEIFATVKCDSPEAENQRFLLGKSDMVLKIKKHVKYVADYDFSSWDVKFAIFS